MSAAYLAADAAALGDVEPPRAAPRRPTPHHILEELEYAGNLFQRAQEAIDAELHILEAAGIHIAGYAPKRVTLVLNQLAGAVRMEAMLARAGRAS
jgi:hypothetical protein